MFRNKLMSVLTVVMLLLSIQSCNNANPVNIVVTRTMKDIEGNVYQTVKIGNQEWMVENLRVTKYNDSSAILLDTSIVTWANATTPKYCYYQNGLDADSNEKFGPLYNWHVVNPANPKKIAPPGWHVPSHSDWDILQKYLVKNNFNWDKTTDTTQTNKLAKSLAAKTDWFVNSIVGTIGCDLASNNSTGFSAIPSGLRDWDGSFRFQGESGVWWSTSENDTLDAYSRGLGSAFEYFGTGSNRKSCGFSVRLVRD